MFTDSTKQLLQQHLPDEGCFHLSGLSHKATPVEIRERFAIKREDYRTLLGEVLTHPAIDEAVLLSTCNRTELITAGDSENVSYLRDHIEEVFEHVSGVARASFSGNMYHLERDEAVSHLFRVAAGLDSMVVGEPQVLGQLKSAFEEASDCGATKELLNRLFHRAFGVAKAIRTETRIGHSAVSVCYAAKELASKIFGDLRSASVLLLGAGETGALALKHLQAAGTSRLLVANKTLQRAATLAESFNALALELSKVDEVLAEADIVIGACSLSIEDSPLLTRESVQSVLRQRKGRPQFFIDLAVPRNFSEHIAELPDAFLYNIDDLEQVVARNLDARSIEVRRAQVIVDDQVRKFTAWLQSRVAVPAIRGAQQRISHIQDMELAKTMRRLRRAGLDEKQCKDIESALADYSQAIVGKLLHRPLHAVRERGATDPAVLSAFKEFFLDTELFDSSNVVRLQKDKKKDAP